jgi:hypothetical protein
MNFFIPLTVLVFLSLRYKVQKTAGMGSKIINVFAGIQIQPQTEPEQKPAELILVMYKEARRIIHRKITESTSNPRGWERPPE